MPRKKMWVEWEDGAELSQSHTRPGQHSPLTRDGDNNLGHVTLSDLDDDEDSASSNNHISVDEEPQDDDGLAGLVALATLLGGAFAAKKLSPHARRIWADKAAPSLKRSRLRLPGGLRSATQESPDLESTRTPSAGSMPAQPVPAAADQRPAMSASEAQNRRLLAFLHMSFGEEQLRQLRRATIVDDDCVGGPGVVLESLSPEQLTQRIRLMLDANPSWLDSSMISELEHLLGEVGRPTDGGVAIERPGTGSALPPPLPGTQF